jgi:Mg-chelatase subunit ChlD
VIFNLDAHNERKGVEAAISKLRWTKGSTKTGYAMRMAYRWIAKKASRKDVNSTFIVVTDGKATDRVEVCISSVGGQGVKTTQLCENLVNSINRSIDI